MRPSTLPTMSAWDWVPIVKTIRRALDDPKGREVTDYAECATTAVGCESKGKAAAELECQNCITKKLSAYIAEWVGFNIGPEMLEGAAGATALGIGLKAAASAATKAATGIGAALLLDDAAEFAIILYKMMQMRDAAATAKKSLCDCGIHGD